MNKPPNNQLYIVFVNKPISFLCACEQGMKEETRMRPSLSKCQQRKKNFKKKKRKRIKLNLLGAVDILTVM